MTTLFAPSSGQPFNVEQNKIRASVSGSWTSIASGTPDRGVEAHGVYWSCITPGAILQIRDREGDEWYKFTATGALAIDFLTLSLPLYTQFEYFDSVGGNVIIIYGKYV
jgi:hypothetical protein